MRTYYFTKLVFTVLLGAALLLLSAVAERGQTEMSRTLVGNFSDVPRMIEALIAGLTAAVGGGAASSYVEFINT